MKKQILSILTIALVLAFASCGPNQAELQAKEKAKMDSVSKAAEEALIAKQKADSITASEKMAAEMEATMQNENCKELRAQLAAAEDKVNELKQFKLLRTPAEKEQQLTDQYRLIEELKDQLKNCN